MTRTAARLTGLFVAATAAPALGGGPDFTRDVRPILSRHCFKCHGQDDKARKGGLRLDDRAAATAPAKSGETAVVPGNPAASELVRRITAADEAEVMPPPGAKNPLSAAEKRTLEAWVAGGGEYRPHWAFVPPTRPAVPTIRSPNSAIRNPIDSFVLARLEKEGLTPSPEADRYTLIRRLSRDLTGLPPTPAEADAFAADKSPVAYEKLVDRLLASPHYGERWARRWLDLARYADTNGYEKDRPRSIWPYRDWVIRALNADLPFDQLTTQQLAGDLLPDPTADQRIATGFHRNTMLNEEGGIDPLEFRFHAVTDRVATTGTVWLGLTVGCAQCHTHKFDPITHGEYYRLLAFFDTADEPDLAVPDAAVAARRADGERAIAAREAELAEKFPGGAAAREAKFDQWLKKESTAAVRWVVAEPAAAKSNLPVLTPLADGSVLSVGDVTKSDTYDLEFAGDFRGVTAVRLEAMTDDRLPARGPGRAYYEGFPGDFFLSEISLTVGGKPVKVTGATETAARANGKGKFAAALALDGVPHSGWAAPVGEDHAAVFALAEPLPAGRPAVRMLFDRHYPAALGRFRVSVTTDPRPVAARPTPADIENLLLEPDDTPGRRDRLRAYYLTVAPELAAEREAIRKLRAKLPEYPRTLVLAERPPALRRVTHVRHRGEYLQPGEAVGPGVPAALPPLPAGPPNRLTPGPVASRSGPPADRPGGGQPRLGGVLRPRAGRHVRRLRLPGGGPVPPGVARLAGDRVRRPRLVAEVAAPADRDERDVSTIVPGDAGPAGHAIPRTACSPAAPGTDWTPN